MLKNIIFSVLGWAVPGLGHFLRGERRRGILFALALTGCLVAGEVMSNFRAVSRKEHEIAFWAQVGAGIPTICFVLYDNSFNKHLGSNKPVQVSPLLDCGIMYTCVAGLLNFVLIVDLLFPLRKENEDD